MILVPAAALAADFRGFASAGPMGLILFQECRGSAPAARVVKVEDATQDGTFSAGIEAVRRIMLNAGRPLYVEFSGDASGQAIKARQFQRAVGTVPILCGRSADCAGRATPGRGRRSDLALRRDGGCGNPRASR